MKHFFQIINAAILFSFVLMFIGCKPSDMMYVTYPDGDNFYVTTKQVNTGEWMSTMDFLPNRIVQATVESSLSDYFWNYRINSFSAPNMTSKYNDI